MLTSSLFFGIFLATMASSWHCALMCGGIAASLNQSVANIKVYPNKKIIFWSQMMVHAGRIFTYMVLGFGVAWIGTVFWQQELIPIQRYLFVLAAGILFYQAYRLIHPSGKKISAMFGQRTAQVLSQWWSKYFIKTQSGTTRWLAGVLWGLLPCGLVYGVLALAFLSGDAVVGAILMLALGLGTLPSLMIFTRLSGSLMQMGQQAWVRYLAAFFLISTAIYGIYSSIRLPTELLRQGFCIA